MDPDRTTHPERVALVEDLYADAVAVLDVIEWITILGAGAMLVLVLARYGWLRHRWLDTAVGVFTAFAHGTMEEYERLTQRGSEDAADEAAVPAEPEEAEQNGPDREGGR